MIISWEGQLVVFEFLSLEVVLCVGELFIWLSTLLLPLVGTCYGYFAYLDIEEGHDKLREQD